MKKLKTLTALISASLAPSSNADDINMDALNMILKNSLNNNSIANISVLNKNVSYRLASHRSHSSHSSHRSSSGGSSSTKRYSAPAPVYTAPTPKTNVSPSYGIKSSTYDPLGQQARPIKSYPNNTSKKPKQTKADIKNIIKQVQLALLLEGLYSGNIDGIMNSETRTAIKTFKSLYDIKSKALLGAKTLNALGVKGF